MVEHILKKGPPTSNFRFVYYEALQNHATTLAATFGETGAYFHFPMSDPQPAEEITVNGVTPNFFESLGVRPLYGRVLLPDDASERPGMPPAVLSYDFWQRRFGGDPGVVNRRTLLVNGHRFVIVGVTPRDFNGLTVETAPDIRVPLRAYCLMANTPKEQMDYELAGRLKPGSRAPKRRRNARRCGGPRWRTIIAILKVPNKGIPGLLAHGMALEPLARGVSILRFRYGDVMKLLMACVALLLLIVCTNVAGLLLERAAARATGNHCPAGGWCHTLAGNTPSAGRKSGACGFGGCGRIGGRCGGNAACHTGVAARSRLSQHFLVPLSLDFRYQLAGFLVCVGSVPGDHASVQSQPGVSPFLVRTLRRGSGPRAQARGAWTAGADCLQIALCTSLLAVASLFVRTFRQLERVNPGLIPTISPPSPSSWTARRPAAGFLKTFAERSARDTRSGVRRDLFRWRDARGRESE